MSDFLSAFGAMDVGKLEFDDVDAKQAIREERFRNAFRHARDTYKAKVDSDAWFFHDVKGGASDADPTVVGASPLTQRKRSSIATIKSSMTLHCSGRLIYCETSKHSVARQVTGIPRSRFLRVSHRQAPIPMQVLRERY